MSSEAYHSLFESELTKYFVRPIRTGAVRDTRSNQELPKGIAVPMLEELTVGIDYSVLWLENESVLTARRPILWVEIRW